VIGSFKSEATENLWLRRKEKSLDPRIWSAALRKLRMLDAAIDVNDLRQPPGNRLEQLAGDRSGEYSIRVNDQWRVVFTWNNGGAHDVEIVDYH
jgi:proteic killer suppression protein